MTAVASVSGSGAPSGASGSLGSLGSIGTWDSLGSSKTSATFQKPATALLSELLEAARNLPSASSDLGTLQLGLIDIKKRAHDLRGKGTSKTDTKAHYLLAGSGINAEEIEHDIRSIDVHQILEPSTTNDFTDIDSYLRSKKEENILASIEGSLRSAAKDFDVFVNKGVNIDWRAKRDDIRRSFGIISGKTRPDINNNNGIRSSTQSKEISYSKNISNKWGKSSLGRNVLGPLTGGGEFTDIETPIVTSNLTTSSSSSSTPAQTTTTTTTNSVLGSKSNAQFIKQKFEKFANVVINLNDTRLQGKFFPICSQFATISDSFGSDTRSQQIYDSWQILSNIIDEYNYKGPTLERNFSKDYYLSINDINNSESIKLRKQIVQGSRQFLEDQFFALVETEISKFPQDAQLGGIPSVSNKIRAYLNLKFSKDENFKSFNLEIVNNDPVWAIIYYMIRSGYLEEALEYTQSIEGIFKKVERSFPTYLKEYVASTERRLPRELLERLHTEFNQHIRFIDEKSDPYKYALYKIIGRCELSRKTIPGILNTVEDWLWAHLVLTREGNLVGEPMQERYSLIDVQRMIVQFGAKHFNPTGSNPGMYFQVLLLSGLFEWAVHYIYSFSEIDGVHFSIVLAYFGLLRVSHTAAKIGETDLITLNQNEQPELNFARMIGYYTRDFRKSDPKIAVDYLILIALNGDLPNGVGEEQLELCHEAIRELVLETREFSRLIGNIKADGSRVPGAIEERMRLINLEDEEDYLHVITQEAARRANEDGRRADAILLYQLSEEYDVVISIINKSLGEILSITELDKPLATLPSGASLSISASEDPAQLARNMLSVYTANVGMLKQVSQRNRETCQLLLSIVEAKEYFVAQKWDESLQKLLQLNIIPIDPRLDLGFVRRKAQQFGSLHESIARNVPGLLVMAMTCVSQLSFGLRRSEYIASSRVDKLTSLKEMAKNCMIYAGMVQYRMPRETYSILISLESSL